MNSLDNGWYVCIVHYKCQINGHWGFETECYLYEDEHRAIEHAQDSIFDHKLYSDESQLKFAFKFLMENKRYDFASSFVEVVRVSNIDQSTLRRIS
jgi:hypothetical protein|tara:strand:- start:253 stop:540 length:288 start_codon:yes stop_codon:yes gene_type:complete